MKILNVGVVGCGGIANNKHLPAMKRTGYYNIVAFCDLVEERAEKAKKEFGTEDARVYTDYEELIKEDLDAVYVLTPNSSHAPVAIAAMKAGKHVMCEKPMAKTFAEAQEMVKTAKETGKILTIGYQNRYRSDSQYLKKPVRTATWVRFITQKHMRSAEERFLHGAYFWMRKSRAAVR